MISIRRDRGNIFIFLTQGIIFDDKGIINFVKGNKKLIQFFVVNTG